MAALYNKSDLVRDIVIKCEVSLDTADKMVEAFLSSTGEALRRGQFCTYQGLGTFFFRERPEGEYYNPWLKRHEHKKAFRRLRFKFSPLFKKACRNVEGGDEDGDYGDSAEASETDRCTNEVHATLEYLSSVPDSTGHSGE